MAPLLQLQLVFAQVLMVVMTGSASFLLVVVEPVDLLLGFGGLLLRLGVLEVGAGELDTRAGRLL